jgi:hypothetical protein
MDATLLPSFFRHIRHHRFSPPPFLDGVLGAFGNETRKSRVERVEFLEKMDYTMEEPCMFFMHQAQQLVEK